MEVGFRRKITLCSAMCTRPRTEGSRLLACSCSRDSVSHFTGAAAARLTAAAPVVPAVCPSFQNATNICVLCVFCGKENRYIRHEPQQF